MIQVILEHTLSLIHTNIGPRKSLLFTSKGGLIKTLRRDNSLLVWKESGVCGKN